jgi:hypothetical protein
VPRLGIIAEDRSDCAAIIVLARRLLAARGCMNPGFKTWSGRGCCRIPTKAASTMNMWARDGVDAVVIVHDLDRDSRTNVLHSEADLRTRLECATASAPAACLICIPVEELEAWFWCDQQVLDRVAGEPNKAKAHYEPHRLAKPKEALIRLSKGENRKPRYDTSENAELAQLLNIELCASRCHAFAQLCSFLNAIPLAA